MTDKSIRYKRTGSTGIILVMIASIAVSGCRVGPDFQRPTVTYFSPDWSESYHPRLQGEAVDLAQWWGTFQDPTLEYLIQTALSENLDLKEAGKRVQEARALRRVVAGNLYPQSQTANAGFGQARISENTANFFSFPGVFEPDLTPSAWNANLAASWELDFWGQYRRAIEAADAQVGVSVGALDLAKVLLIGELAGSYIEMRTWEARLTLASQNIAIQEKTLNLIKQKLEAGVSTELDRHQAEANLAQTQAILPALEIARRQSCHRICVLLGRPAIDLTQELGWTAHVPTPPPSIATGIPADLLRRRPDIRVAEMELATQSAKIGIAQADFYPRISLNGSIGLESEDVSRLFQTSSLVGLAGPQVSWKILNYGRLQARVEAERAAFDQRCFAYHQAVLKAHQEVQDAQVAYCLGFDQVEAAHQAVQHTASAVEIAQKAFDDGATDYNRVYLLQSDLVRQQDALAETQGKLAQSLVRLFVALGGGWEQAGCTTLTTVSTDAFRQFEPGGEFSAPQGVPSTPPTSTQPDTAPQFDPMDSLSQLVPQTPTSKRNSILVSEIQFAPLPR